MSLTAWSELSATERAGEERRTERWGRVRFVVTVRSGTSLPGRRGADGFVADGEVRNVVDGVVRRGVAWHVADGQARQGMSAGSVWLGQSLTAWSGLSKTERCGMD